MIGAESIAGAEAKATQGRRGRYRSSSRELPLYGKAVTMHRFPVGARLAEGGSDGGMCEAAKTPEERAQQA